MTKIFSKKNMILWIMALAIVLRLIALGKSFQGDEYSSIIDARSFAAIPEALLSDTHPPLYFYLLNMWMKMSMNEAFLRLLSIIPGVALCFLIYLVGKKTFDETVGLGAALLLALAPIAVWSSQYIRTYSLAAFFSVLSIYFLIRLFRDGSGTRSDWIWYIIASSASIYTFYFSALIIIAENIYVTAYFRKKEFLMKWALSQLAVFILYMPWLPFFYFQRSSYVGHPQMLNKVGFYIGNIHIGALLRSGAGLVGFDPRLFSREMISAHALYKIGGVAVGFVLAIIIIWVIVRYFKMSTLQGPEKRSLDLLLFIGIIPFLIALALHQTAGIILMSHYFIVSFAFFALFLVAIAGKSMSRRAFLIAISFVALLYLMRLVVMYQDKETDFKDAHQYIKKYMAAYTMVVSPSFGGTFDYYFYDVPARKDMERLGSRASLGTDLFVIEYPTKLELKALHARFMRFVSPLYYNRISSAKFGDLTVERYIKK